ncbi:hypothetical protein ACQY0O_000079 [Thecaphora frezii]
MDQYASTINAKELFSAHMQMAARTHQEGSSQIADAYEEQLPAIELLLKKRFNDKNYPIRMKKVPDNDPAVQNLFTKSKEEWQEVASSTREWPACHGWLG